MAGQKSNFKRVERRRKSAETQASSRAYRTPKQQLALIAERPGESRKETARLLKQIREARS
jgi:hypothetical protein